MCNTIPDYFRYVIDAFVLIFGIWLAHKWAEKRTRNKIIHTERLAMYRTVFDLLHRMAYFAAFSPKGTDIAAITNLTNELLNTLIRYSSVISKELYDYLTKLLAAIKANQNKKDAIKQIVISYEDYEKLKEAVQEEYQTYKIPEPPKTKRLLSELSTNLNKWVESISEKPE